MSNLFIATHIPALGRALLEQGKNVQVPTWQALDVRDMPQGRTVELTDQMFVYDLPGTPSELQKTLKPNLPWAENQFKERVAGHALNPGFTFTEWPWYKGNVERHKEQGKFSHTYMERYWPKQAGEGAPSHAASITARSNNRGIRFEYGDLSDVVKLLAREPATRQAYLPVFFPEDTGAHHGERVPCSLGYLFLMRDGKLNITYYIRSCDFYRHFRDDVYMTARLCQWVIQQVQETNLRDISDDPEPWDTVLPGRLTMNIGSLHVFEGDLPRLRKEYGDG